MKFTCYILFFFLCCSASLEGQTVDWLKASTSAVTITNHSFYTSAEYNNTFYFAGDFWKDLIIDDYSIEIGGDTGNGHIIRMDENGIATALWHLKGTGYVRINDIEVNPTTESLIVTGNFRENMIFQDDEWETEYYGDGYIMSISPDGSLDWIQLIKPQNEFSFAVGQNVAIDKNGNVFMTFEGSGEVTVAGETFYFNDVTNGAVIVKLDSDGALLDSDIWQSNNYEGSIDVVALKIDQENNIIIGGSVGGEANIADSLFTFSPLGTTAFIVKVDENFHLQWLKKYESPRTHVRDIFIDDASMIVSLQYNNAVEIGGEWLSGSGSWGDMAIFSLDENTEVAWVKNFTLTENGGIYGVYGSSIEKWRDQYYIGGMYQGDVEHEGELILDNITGASSFQLPFIISLDKNGSVTSSYNFSGSTESSRITCISGNESHLIFGGDFSGKVRLGDHIVNTVNSALFYGALKNDATSIEKHVENSISIYPTVTSDFIQVESTHKIHSVTIISSDGRIVKTNTLKNDLVDIRELQSGMYFLVSEAEGLKMTRKFIKI